ncbi:MAG: hypothetical protein HFJ45_02295 [Clostridia bacterium]|nr:hypothetical protein [Clostridia bacterium]
MKNLIKFFIFIVYSTIIFFLPNNKFILILILLNFLLMIFLKKYIKNIIINTLKLVPFIIFTFIINLFMDNFINSIWIGVKLLIVCNITVIYANTNTILKIAETMQLLCSPLKIFKIDTNEIKILVCISLSMIPVLKNELYEIKYSCRAKNISFNIKNMKIILSKLFVSLIMRANQIEESLIAKGYDS